MNKKFLIIVLCVASVYLVFPQNQTAPVLSDDTVLAFIRNWPEINRDIRRYREANRDDEYFRAINTFIYSLSDMTIFLLGYTDETLQTTVISLQNQFNELLVMQPPDEIAMLFANAEIQNGSAAYITLLIGGLLVGIEKRAMYEQSNPNNTVQTEPVLKHTRACFAIINEDDLAIIERFLPQLPREINSFFYNMGT